MRLPIKTLIFQLLGLKEQQIAALTAERDVAEKADEIHSKACNEAYAKVEALIAERDSLKLYHDCTYGLESAREIMVKELTAERDELQAILVASEPPYYTKWKEVTAENKKLREGLRRILITSETIDCHIEAQDALKEANHPTP